MPCLKGMLRSSLLALCVTILILTPGISGETTSTIPASICPVNQLLEANSDVQEFHSPNYPNNYLNNANCSWHIVAPFNSSLRISVPSYDIERGDSCGYDALEIFNGPNRFGQRLAKLCGQGSLSNYQVAEAFVIFRTDSSVTAEGFNLTYWSGPWTDQENATWHTNSWTDSTWPEPETTVPGQTNSTIPASICPVNQLLEANSDVQEFHSPNYPNNYFNNVNCSWHIVAPFNSSLRISVPSYDIERGDSCGYDALEIFNGPNRFGPLLAKLCGQGSLSDYQVAEAFVIFRTDSSVTAEGFSLTYWSGPWTDQENATWHTNSWTDSTWPEPETTENPSWHTNSRPDSSLPQPEPTGNPTWHTNSWPQPEPTGNPTWHTNSWPQPEPTENPNWHTNSWTGSTWPEHPSTVFADSTCPRNLFLTATSTYQEINSPGYPNNYYNNADCSWYIVAPINRSLQISVSSYDIESHHTCDYDALEIFNGQNRFSQRLANLCGQSSYTLHQNNQVTEAFIRFHTDVSITRRGFQLTFWTGPLNSQGDDPEPDHQEGQPCDGSPHVMLATSDLQFLESPGYPDSYNNGMDCSWSIQFPEGVSLRIRLEDFALENHYRCGYDALDIYNGSPSFSRQRLASLCGTMNSVSYTIQGEAFIHFHTDGSITGKGFKLSYQTTSETPQDQPCNGGILVLQASEFPETIESPNYPSNYPNYANCSWRIESSPDHQVKVSLEYFRLENHYSCSFDALEIFDGQNRMAPRLANLCGYLSSGDYGSSSSVMYMNFHSDFSITFRGFRLSYMQVHVYHPGCHGQTLSVQALTSPRSLVSPGYPDSYSNDMECQWLLLSSSEFLLIIIEDLKLQDSTNCSSDALEIFDGGSQYHTQLANLCGEISPGSEEFIIQSSSVFIRFHSDHSQSNEGFTFTYQSVDANYFACHRGPWRLNVSQYSNEVIFSPDFPNYYFDNTNCQWRVDSTLDFVQITVNSISSGLKNNCSGDVLQIFDGVDDAAPLLVNFCDQISRTTYRSSSKTVFIRFHSTAVDSPSRFKLTFKGLDESYAACVGQPLELRAESFAKNFSSPNYPGTYPNNARCKWLITSSKPYIKLSLRSYRIEYDGSCSYDALEIFNGPDSSSPQLADLCGSSYSGNVYISSSNVTYIYFRSDHSITLSGFNLVYEALEDYIPACVGRDLELDATFELQTLESPGYPVAYKNDMTCSWTIRVANGFVSLRVEDIDLGNGPNCSQDRLEIFDGYGHNVTLCGQDSSNSPVFRSRFNFVYVRFYSDGSITNRGFRLSYERQVIEGCHGRYAYREANSSVQIIESPFYPSNYTNDAYCRWRIISNSGFLLIYIEDLSLEYSHGCFKDYLRIDEGYFGASLAKVCGKESPYLHSNLISSNIHTSVSFRSDFLVSDKGFRLRFRSVSQEYIACSGNGPVHIRANSSLRNISSPNYPDGYPDDSECTWLIQSDLQFGILKIDFLRFPENSSCAESSLEIFEGQNQSSRSLKRFCGEYSSDSSKYITFSNKVFIQFISTRSVTHGGFKLSYRAASFEELACTNGPHRLQLQASHTLQPLFMYLPRNSFLNHTGCFWQIWSSTGFVRAIININHTVYSEENPCLNNNLEIYDGADETFPSLGTLCQLNFDHQRISSSRELFFHLNHFTAFSGILIHILFNTVDEKFPACTDAPLELQATSFPQTIVSPGYPNHTMCMWQISSEKNFVLITIEDLRVECGHPYYDEFKFSDGNPYTGSTQQIVNFCNGSQEWGHPRTFWSSSNTTNIYFMSGWGPNVRHFRLMYRSVDETFKDACHDSPGRYYAASYAQSLESPGYPISYFNNIDCTWMITSPPDKLIQVTVEDLRLQPDSNCSDYIELHKEMPQYSFQPWDEMCGTDSANQTYLSSSAMVFIHFHTDSQHTSNGFRLTYKSIDPSDAACINHPQDLAAQSDPGFITSPGYPNTYPDNSNCAWKIQVPSGRVLLSVTSLMIGNSTDCMNEALELFDGTSPNEMSLVKLCGVHPHSLYVSSSTAMYVQFHSDGSTVNAQSGFHLAYQWIPADHQACFGTTVEVSVNSVPQAFTLYGDHFVNASVNCAWHLKSDVGFIRILPTWWRFDTTPGCDIEALEIFDGDSNASQRMARTCGQSHNFNMTSYKSTSNEIFVQANYYSEVSFSFLYVNVLPDQACNGEPAILQASFEPKTIESPGYAESYPNNADCRWKIEAADGIIEVYVVHLNLQRSDGCISDSLEIFDGPSTNATRLRRLCGNSSAFWNPSPITSSSNELFLHFQTDSSNSLRGFLMVYGKQGMRLPNLF